MSTVFVDNGRILSGRGEESLEDPGTGTLRYRNAHSALLDSGREIAFASFTFDIEESGSVVAIPDSVGVTVPEQTPGPGGYEVVDDGVSEWRSAYRRAMGAIGAGQVEKVVVARQLLISTQVAPEGLLARLMDLSDPGFLFSIEGLVGASPELLVRVEEGVFESQVLAGTSSSDGSLESEKLGFEHDLAARSLIAPVEKLLLGPPEVERGVVSHGVVKHLATRVSGELRPGITALDALKATHPTAAVAGTPTEGSVQLIRQIEAKSRGRYAGPVGWFDIHGNGLFAIALRCVQFGDNVTLYAGGGLVEGSAEDEELDETELKLRTILSALDQI